MAAQSRTATAWSSAASGPAGLGTIPWFNHGDATGATANAVYADATDSSGVSSISDMICLHGFGFDLPVGAVVLGVSTVLDVSGFWTSQANPAFSVGITLLENSTSMVGANRAVSESWTTVTTIPYGSATDTWAWGALDRSKVITTGFGLGVQVQGGLSMEAHTSTAYLDRVTMTVHFSYPDYVLPASLGMFDPVMRKEGWF